MDQIVFKDPRYGKQVLDILDENEQWIVVNKPPRLPVIPDRFATYYYNVRDLLNKYLQKEDQKSRIWVVHRIDADTSGIVLFAKTENYHRLMSTLFENQMVEKHYLAIVHGIPEPHNGIIDQPVLKSARNMIIHHKGKASRTSYEVRETFDGYSLVVLKPLSGRTHQIRVHLKSMGCPLAVDPLYGKHDNINLAQIKAGYQYKKEQQPRPLCSRLTLHAQSIEFKDPLTGTIQKYETPLPKDILAVIKALRKYRNQRVEI